MASFGSILVCIYWNLLKFCHTFIGYLSRVPIFNACRLHLITSSIGIHAALQTLNKIWTRIFKSMAVLLKVQACNQIDAHFEIFPKGERNFLCPPKRWDNNLCPPKGAMTIFVRPKGEIIISHFPASAFLSPHFRGFPRSNVSIWGLPMPTANTNVPKMDQIIAPKDTQLSKRRNITLGKVNSFVCTREK